MAPARKTRVMQQADGAPVGRRLDKFPEFRDGNVRIIVTADLQYTLHTSVLKNNSPVMREMLDDDFAAKLSTKAVKAGATTRFHLILVDGDEDSKVEYVLEPVEVDTNGRPVKNSMTSIGMSLDKYEALPQIFIAYDIVLRAFYNEPISLGNAQEDILSDLLSTALSVTAVAEYLECTQIITQPIESTLLATGQHLYRAIANNPSAWLIFAHRIKSKAIFKEALIHAAALYNMPTIQTSLNSGEMPVEVAAVLKQKFHAIKISVQRAERHFSSYYPSMLMREKTVGNVGRENIGRANYANDIIMWIALTLFRHWVCDMLAADYTHHAKDIGFAFMRTVAKGGDAYLAKDLMEKSFHQRFPMSPKGKACVEHRLTEIKEVVKQWAAPLMKKSCQLDIEDSPVDHFVHINVDEKDYPWSDEFVNENEDVEEQTVAQQVVEVDDEQGESEEEDGGEEENGAEEDFDQYDDEDLSDVELDDAGESPDAVKLTKQERAEIDGFPFGQYAVYRGPIGADDPALQEHGQGQPTQEELDGVPLSAEEMDDIGREAYIENDDFRSSIANGNGRAMDFRTLAASYNRASSPGGDTNAFDEDEDPYAQYLEAKKQEEAIIAQQKMSSEERLARERSRKRKVSFDADDDYDE